MIYSVAHFSGEPNDDFVANLDILPAKNKEDENCAEILLAVSEDNLYDGIVGRGYPTDLKRTFIAIRKKGSDEVYQILSSIIMRMMKMFKFLDEIG